MPVSRHPRLRTQIWNKAKITKNPRRGGRILISQTSVNMTCGHMSFALCTHNRMACCLIFIFRHTHTSCDIIDVSWGSWWTNITCHAISRNIVYIYIDATGGGHDDFEAHRQDDFFFLRNTKTIEKSLFYDWNNIEFSTPIRLITLIVCWTADKCATEHLNCNTNGYILILL